MFKDVHLFDLARGEGVFGWKLVHIVDQREEKTPGVPIGMWVCVGYSGVLIPRKGGVCPLGKMRCDTVEINNCGGMSITLDS